MFGGETGEGGAEALEKVRAALNHDLRTPLTVIISYAHTLAQGKAGPLTDKQRELLETVVEQGFKMDAMLNELVSVMRQALGPDEGPGPRGQQGSMEVAPRSQASQRPQP